MEDSINSTECSKDTLYLIKYFDKRLQGIENELKTHSSLLQKLVGAAFREEITEKFPTAVLNATEKKGERNSPTFGYPSGKTASTEKPRDPPPEPSSLESEKQLIIEPIDVEFKESLVKPPAEPKFTPTSSIESQPKPPTKVEEKKVVPIRNAKTPTNLKRIDPKFKPKPLALPSKSPRALQTARSINKFANSSRNVGTKSTTSLLPLKSPRSAVNAPLTTKHSGPVSKKPRPTQSLDSLPGRCLDLIAEFMGQEFPTFAVCNKKTLKQYASYKVEEYEVQIELLQDEYNQTKAEIVPNYKTHRFKLLQSTRMEYDGLKMTDWSVLFSPRLEHILSTKDTAILRLYFTFMGKDAGAKKEAFLGQCKHFFTADKGRIAKVMDPEAAFIFNEAIIKKIVDLLITLKNQATNISGASTFMVFDVLAGIVIEALKFAQVVPGAQESELGRIGREIAKCKKVKATLEKYSRLKTHK